MKTYVEDLIDALNLEVISELHTPSRPERRHHLPEEILVGTLPETLKRLLGREDLTVWEHQAKAIEHLANRRNVVVSTGTASGKSLVFQIDAIRRLSADPASRVLVNYPLKALASDQFGRWKRLIKSIGLDETIVGRIDDVAKTADALTRELAGALRTVDERHNAALWAHVRKAFDYPVFVAAPKSVGITSTGETGENVPTELPALLEAYRQFEAWVEAGAKPSEAPDFHLPSAA